MKNLDLTKILKDCPRGTELWSPIWGNVKFLQVERYDHLIEIAPKEGLSCYLLRDGRLTDNEYAECVLFPSKENRDWNKVQAEYTEITKAMNSVVVEEIKKNLFQPFQRVLVRDNTVDAWKADLYSHYDIRVVEGYPHHCVGGPSKYCIPYEGNEELCGTTNDPNIKKD